MLKFAHRMGWRPTEFWAATLWEFETAMLAQIEMNAPPKAAPASASEVLAGFRALPGYQRVEAG